MRGAESKQIKKICLLIRLDEVDDGEGGKLTGRVVPQFFWDLGGDASSVRRGHHLGLDGLLFGFAFLRRSRFLRTHLKI